MKMVIKQLIETLTRTHIYRALPQGLDKFANIRSSLPAFWAHTVFDVGAHTGESAREYLNHFPEARIYCFEPVKATFKKLITNLTRYDNVHCFNVALGALKTRSEMVLEGTSDMYHMVNPTDDELEPDVKTEEVAVESLDEFCRDNNINSISYLKVDTEGYDLEVLKGAEGMLAKGLIDVIEVEAGMNPGNKRHVSFEILKEYLEKRDYYLFGIFEQVHEWPTHEPHLRRTNPVYISSNVISSNRQ